MDYNTLFLSICEISDRLPKELDWDANITIQYGKTTYNSIYKKYIKEDKLFRVDYILFDLSNFDHLKYMMIAYETLYQDKEMYLVQCIHSIFAIQLLKIFPEIEKEQICLFYKIDDVRYPFLVNKKYIIE